MRLLGIKDKAYSPFAEPYCLVNYQAHALQAPSRGSHRCHDQLNEINAVIQSVLLSSDARSARTTVS